MKVNGKEKESVDALDEREKKSFFYNCVTNKLLWLPEMQLWKKQKFSKSNFTFPRTSWFHQSLTKESSKSHPNLVSDFISHNL